MEAALAQLGRDLVLYNVETNAQHDRYFSQLPMQHKVDGLVMNPRLNDGGLSLPFRADLSVSRSTTERDERLHDDSP